MNSLAGRIALVVLVAALSVLPAAAFAAESATLTRSMEALVGQAKKDGLTVIVISPGQDRAAQAGSGLSDMMTDMGLSARQNLKRILLNSQRIFSDIAAAIDRASPDGTFSWLYLALATAVGGILVGFLPARAIQYWAREHFRYMYSSEPRDDAEKIGYLLFRAFIMLLNSLLLFAVAAIIAIVFDSGHVPSRRTVFTIVATFVAWRIGRAVVLHNLMAPDLPAYRMVNLGDADARTAYNDWRWVLAVSLLLFGVSVWLERIGLARDSQTLVILVASLVCAALIAVMAVRHRKMFAGVILGRGDPEAKPVWRRFVAATWHIFTIAYLAAAWAVSSAGLLLDKPANPMLIAAPPAAFMGGLAAYGILVLVVEYVYRARRAAYERRLDAAVRADIEQRKQEEAARREALAQGIPAGEEEAENVGAGVGPDHPVKPQFGPQSGPQFKPLFKPLALRAAGIAVTIGALAFVLGAWNIRAGERGNPVTAFMDILVIAFIAWILYEALKVYVEARLAEEGASPSGAMVDVDDEAAAHGATRLGTLLPLLRNVLTVAIFAVAGMIILSHLGVDIAPLFAGAGVIGLAVGFGAQTLIRDIFSGGFFLFDDAFRKGEYIELGDIRGTVEKISLRSFQLRHHNGPLHTIPFGEIKQLTNYSRDWVIMKLPLRLTFDTDIEKVRKLVKKLGQQLLQDPEIGANFLQPLKSQGVVEIDDSAMIVRVKFMTRPGDQWVTRKKVYASIQELFMKEGIRFANREVTVRIAGENDRPRSEHEVEAAAAAARRMIDDGPGPKPAGSGDDR